MNVYAETNFVLELTFEQEQCSNCEQILSLCETGQAKLIKPAYSLAEPHEKLTRQSRNRRELQQLLDAELRQLSRTASYASRIRMLPTSPLRLPRIRPPLALATLRPFRYC